MLKCQLMKPCRKCTICLCNKYLFSAYYVLDKNNSPCLCRGYSLREKIDNDQPIKNINVSL